MGYTLDASEAVKKAFLLSWCTQSGSGKNWGTENLEVPQDYKKRFDEFLKNSSDEIVNVTRVIPDRALTIASVIDEVVEGYSQSDRIQELDALLKSRSFTVASASAETVHKQMFYWVDRAPNEARKAAQAIAASPDKIDLLFAWIAQALRETDEDPHFYHRKASLLEVAGYIGEFSPAATYNLISKYELEHRIADAAIHQTRFYARAGAVRLMAFMRNTPTNFVWALTRCLQDVPEVQQPALETASNLRHFDPVMVSDLFALLRDKDTSVIYVVVRILVTVGRSEKTDSQTRQQILTAMANAFRDPLSKRGVFVFGIVSSNFFIRRVDTLRAVYYNAMLEITNAI